MRLDARKLDRRIVIERPTPDDSLDGAGSGGWTPVATVWAEVQAALPSRGERLAEGINVSSRPARVRMRWRGDIDASMRIVFDGRIMQIVGGPVELGRRDGIEMMVEDYTSAGNAA